MRHTPYLNYVRSFETSARHLSFTAAAEELNYTQSAISNHVRSLEEFIGRPLFIRYARSLALTSAGEAYLPSVRNALEQIDMATESIITTQHEKKATISCPASLAQNWLASVIGDFNRDHPDISVTIHGTIWNDVEPEVADIQLTSRRDDEAPAGGQMLWRDRLAIVCAPSWTHITCAADLCDANLIHHLGRSAYWQSFAEAFDLPALTLTGGLKTDSLNVGLELATSGQGCAIVPKSLITPYLERGLLIEPFAFELESPWSCYISKPAPSMSKSATLLRHWLLAYKHT